MKAQNLPHYGIKNGFTRNGKAVCTKPETKNAAGEIAPATFKIFDSISKAKHYMRVGP